MLRRLALLFLAIGSTCSVGLAGASEDYFRIVRLSYLDGHVSFQHAGEVDWTAASINMPLQPGDRIYTGNDGRAEIEFDDGSVCRLAEGTDVEILSLKEDLIQVRMLIGLSTLNVQSGVNFEVDTPAAAFNTVLKGVYRFDVIENGDTDAIVRKGLLEAANDQFTQQVESGDLLHVIPGDKEAPALSRYEQRDGWDEWNDRRNADMLAVDSRGYIPDSVHMGVSELESYGRWISVETYGVAWIPYGVDPTWSPYWEGRWCYRPSWGWTWVSYEPWGWLPYHYGRWYHSASFGWCWLPGPSFTFNFWSPGLVRFYNGPGWVSWCPLGPHDYYNVNNYYFNRSYAYQLNNLRTLQTRGPGDLANRNSPGAFRTVETSQFVSSSFGGRGRVEQVTVDQPWSRGRMVTDRLGIQPTAMSYSPAPDRPVIRPSAEPRLPTVVRSEPSFRPAGQERTVRITNPNVTPLPSTRVEGRGAVGNGTVAGRQAITPGRSEPQLPTVIELRRQSSPASGSDGRTATPQPEYSGRSTARGQAAPPAAPQRDRPGPAMNEGSRSRANSGSSPSVRPAAPPAAPPRYERVPVPERKQESDRPKPESKPRNDASESARVSNSNSYESESPAGPRVVEIGRGSSSNVASQSRQVRPQQSGPPAGRVSGYPQGSGYVAPSSSPQERAISPPSNARGREYSAVPEARGGQAGGAAARSAPARTQSALAGGGRQKGR